MKHIQKLLLALLLATPFFGYAEEPHGLNPMNFNIDDQTGDFLNLWHQENPTIKYAKEAVNITSEKAKIELTNASIDEDKKTTDLEKLKTSIASIDKEETTTDLNRAHGLISTLYNMREESRQLATANWHALITAATLGFCNGAAYLAATVGGVQVVQNALDKIPYSYVIMPTVEILAFMISYQAIENWEKERKNGALANFRLGEQQNNAEQLEKILNNYALVEEEIKKREANRLK